MLNADSSALNSESELQRRKTPPMIPSVFALSWIVRTVATMSPIERDGNSWFSSFTSVLDSSTRWKRPSSASARNVSGRNETSAK